MNFFVIISKPTLITALNLYGIFRTTLAAYQFFIYIRLLKRKINNNYTDKKCAYDNLQRVY